jgi:hypothetical protein
MVMRRISTLVLLMIVFGSNYECVEISPKISPLCPFFHQMCMCPFCQIYIWAKEHTKGREQRWAGVLFSE